MILFPTLIIFLMKTSFTKISLLLIFFTVASAFGQIPARDLQDIIGERGSYAEMDLEKRGYVHIKTKKLGYDVYSNWWNTSKKKCVSYHLADGRVRSVNEVPQFDCNKSSNSGYSYGNSYGHSSYHHSNNSHYDKKDQDMAFERGHNDALHNKSYHNIYGDQNLKNAYSNGYDSGVRQRKSNTSYHSGRGGYSPHTSVNDVVGLSVEGAIEKMAQKGFSKVDQYKHDGKTHRIFYNSKTRQCVDLRSMHGKVGHVENSTRCNR